jgi:hypothetical protein
VGLVLGVAEKGAPERREFAKRWALDASCPFRCRAAAGWLLRHPVAGEAEHVRWLLTDLAVKDSLHDVKAALAHPDDAVAKAAIALLPRAFDAHGGAELVAVVQRSFDPWPDHAEPWFAMMALARYLDAVNVSGHTSSPDSIRTSIELTQRYLASASEEEIWSGGRVLVPGRRGVPAPAPARLARRTGARSTRYVRRASGSVGAGRDGEGGDRQRSSPGQRDGADLDAEMLQAVADTGDSMMAISACSLLLDRAAPDVALLLDEWSTVSDAVLVDQETAPARFYAVQDRLRRQAPRKLARMLVDRLLALPPDLRRFGLLQVLAGPGARREPGGAAVTAMRVTPCWSWSRPPFVS